MMRWIGWSGVVAGTMLVAACSDGATDPNGPQPGAEGTMSLSISGAISADVSGTASFIPQNHAGDLVLLRMTLQSDGYDPGADTEGVRVDLIMNNEGQPINLTTTSYPTGRPEPGYVGVGLTHRPGDGSSETWIAAQLAGEGAVVLTHVSDDRIAGTVNMPLRSTGPASTATQVQVTGEFNAICPAPYC